MQYTVRQCVDRLLGYLTKEERTLPPIIGEESEGRALDAVVAVNGALQEIHTFAPKWVGHQPFGFLANAEFETEVEVLEGSHYARFVYWQDWMLGCTIRIEGEEVDNEIVAYDSNDVEITLRNPVSYSGDTHDYGKYGSNHDQSPGVSGTKKKATVYHDCITMPENLVEVTSKVVIPGVGELLPVSSERELIAKGHRDSVLSDRDFGRRFFRTFTDPDGKQPTGTPAYFYLDTVYSDAGPPIHRMKISPMPDDGFTIEFKARVEPKQFDEFDVWSHLSCGLDDFALIQAAPGDTFVYIKPDVGYSASDTGSSVSITGINMPGLEDGVYKILGLDVFGVKVEVDPLPGAIFYSPLGNERLEFSGTAQDPGVIVPVPSNYTESVLIPVAAQRFKADANFRNDAVTSEVSRQYGIAMEILKKNKPQKKRRIRILPNR